MADSQTRTALANLGANARADFHYLSAAWRNDWLLPVSVCHTDWLATEPLVAEMGYVQAPFDSLLDLQRFLTAGFLPSVDTPRQESAPAATADRAHTAAMLAALGRATSTGQATTVDHTQYPLPSLTDVTLGDPVPVTLGDPVPVDMPSPAVSPRMTPPQHPRTTEQAWAAPSAAWTPSPDPGLSGTPMSDTIHGRGLRALAQEWSSPGAVPPQQASYPSMAGEPPAWAVHPTRVGGLRDLAQRLPAGTDLPAPQTAQPAAPARRPWSTYRPDASAQRVDDQTIAPDTSLMASPPTGAAPQPTAPTREDAGSAISPVIASARTAPAAHTLHGQSGQLPAPAVAIPPIPTTPPQVDNWMDALAREITREYHRFYGA